MFPSLEIHIPISPTTSFLNMVHYQLHSLRTFGGACANARFILTIGDKKIDNNLRRRHPWLDKYNVETRWVPLEVFAKHSYYGTANERFSSDFKADIVVMADADILFVRPFDEVVLRCHREQKIAGVLAHVCPFKKFDEWQKIYDACGMGPVRAPYQHTGWGYLFNDPTLRYCPPYFNFGAVFIPREMAFRIAREIDGLMVRTNKVIENWARNQICFSLAITKLGLNHECLPIRYNFPNLLSLEAMYGPEQAHASILHMFDKNQGMDKRTIFKSFDRIEAILAREDLAGINVQMQKVLRAVYPKVKEEQ